MEAVPARLPRIADPVCQGAVAARMLTDPPRGLESEARAEVSRYFEPPQVGAIVEVVALCNAWNRVTRGME